MSISIKEVPSLVIPAELEPEGIEPGFYLGTARPSVEKPHLQIHPVLFSDGSQTIGFLVRTSEEAKIGQCTGADLKDYQQAQGVRMDPFKEGILKDDDGVLVIELGNTETFLMRPTGGNCHGVQYNFETRELIIPYEGAHKMGGQTYGFTIDLGPDGPVFSGDFNVNPFSY